MSPEAQRIAIAEACGWRVENRDDGQIKWSVLISPDKRPVDSTSGSATLANFGCLPDYLNDLNAIHSAELVLDWDEQTSTQLFNYRCALTKVCGNDRDLIPFASAWQRAEALLKTLGKWDDSK
jgi:hypothetical protein